MTAAPLAATIAQLVRVPEEAEERRRLRLTPEQRAAEDARRVPCTLDACRICTGCAHSGHAACRRTVTCPTDRVTRPCSCCGDPS